MLDAYVERHARNDRGGVIALFEPDATVEDPVGSPTHHGLDAIDRFYAETHARNGTMKIEPVGAPLFGGNELAAHVRAELDSAGSPPAMDVIYVIRFSEAGRIQALRVGY